MKRLHILHSRDKAVHSGWRWDLWATDTHDPHAEPLWLAWGSYNAMRHIAAVLLVMNSKQVRSPYAPKDMTDFHFGGFQCENDRLTKRKKKQ